MEWIKINDQTPICYEEGDWDGLRSKHVLVISNGFYNVARMYEDFIDGSKSSIFYTEDGYEVKDVTEWCVIRQSTHNVIHCSCDCGIIVCTGCNGEESKFGKCAGCKGSGIRTCGKCGGLNNDKN